jgi:hypothetical protein
MAEEADPRPAPFLRDIELEEPLVAQPPVILYRVARVAIVLGRAGGEIRRQLAAALLQPPVLLADPEIHPSGPRHGLPRS